MTQETTTQHIRQHSRELVRELDFIKGIFQNTGYTYSQCHILFELEQHQQLTLMDLSNLLLLDKSNTSRSVKKLVTLGLIQVSKSHTDQRKRLFSLTSKGKKAVQQNNCLANDQVDLALDTLQPEQQAKVMEGLRIYARALRKSRRQADFSFRLIQKKDNPAMGRVIRKVMTEFNAVGPDYSISDPEVDDMYSAYKDKRATFYVIEYKGEVVGGGGVAPLKGGKHNICELQKMYFLPVCRGVGLGQQMLSFLLVKAKKIGYQKCYLETLDRMWQANQLYIKNGFQPLKKAMGNTGHCGCDRWYMKKL